VFNQKGEQGHCQRQGVFLVYRQSLQRWQKNNDMYADHKSCDHDSWRKTIYDRCATRNTGGKPSTETPTDPTHAAAPEKKLTLNGTSFGMHSVLRLDSLLKLSIAFGKMLRETSRSESRVE
jgi:hypothetical protein